MFLPQEKLASLYSVSITSKNIHPIADILQRGVFMYSESNPEFNAILEREGIGAE